MNDLYLIGTSAYPLRCSGLPSLVKCPWRAAIMFLELEIDSSGAAAQTGSMMHHGAAEWHRSKRDFDHAKASMLETLEDFPLANTEEAVDMLEGYCLDPRNINADVIEVEQRVTFEIPCSEADPTQAPIVIQGTLDQIRNVNGVLQVYDIKTSKRDGYDLMCEHTLQVAAYVWGASQRLGKKAEPGALILPRKYCKRVKRGEKRDLTPQGSFIHFPWSYKHIALILSSVQTVVAHLRAGDLWAVPGDYCRYCPAQGPDRCIPHLQELVVRA